MTRKIIIALMLLAVHLMPETKQLRNSESIDVLGTYTNTQNDAEPRSESISADITGHILTNLRI